MSDAVASLSLPYPAEPPKPSHNAAIPSKTPSEVIYTGELPFRRVVVNHEDPGIAAGYDSFYDYCNQKLSISAYWELIWCANATANTPLKFTKSYTKGVQTTDTTTKEFALSIGAQGSLASISATLSKSVSQSISLSESTTEEQEYNLHTDKGTVYGAFWQLVRVFTITGDKKTGLQFIKSDNSRESPQYSPAWLFETQLVNKTDVFRTTTFNE